VARGDDDALDFAGTNQLLRGKPHIIRLAQIPLYQRAQLFLVRLNQFNIADIKRCGERIAGTINNTAQSMLLRVSPAASGYRR
jgi:hypothetical protein